jgi:hypothetical protein
MIMSGIIPEKMLGAVPELFDGHAVERTTGIMPDCGMRHYAV